MSLLVFDTLANMTFGSCAAVLLFAVLGAPMRKWAAFLAGLIVVIYIGDALTLGIAKADVLVVLLAIPLFYGMARRKIWHENWSRRK